jgi:hypothetical protein
MRFKLPTGQKVRMARTLFRLSEEDWKRMDLWLPRGRRERIGPMTVDTKAPLT